MGIEWFRDLTIIVSGLAIIIACVIVVSLSLRLYSSAKGVLDELRMASTLARNTAEMVRAGVKPISRTLAVFRAMREGYQHGGTSTRKQRT
jgi:hypothetical protein